MPRRAVSRYDPLGAYLAGQPPAVVELTLTLAELEAILGAALPRSAREGSFWGNAVNEPRVPAHVRAWRRAGWRVAAFERASAAVTFVRAPAG